MDGYRDAGPPGLGNATIGRAEGVAFRFVIRASAFGIGRTAAQGIFAIVRIASTQVSISSRVL
mgnify:CR=1 FL=1